jgi:hypothetical protein
VPLAGFRPDDRSEIQLAAIDAHRASEAVADSEPSFHSPPRARGRMKTTSRSILEPLVEVVAITRAPKTRANCSANTATPPEPWIRTVSPAVTRRWPVYATQAVTAAQGRVTCPPLRNRKFADSPLEGNCVDALRGSRAFLASDCHVGCRFVSGLFARPMAAGLDGFVWTPSAGQGRFWLRTVMSVAGLCPACSRGQWPLALMDCPPPEAPIWISRLMRIPSHRVCLGSRVRLTVHHLLRPAFRNGTWR